MVDRHPNVVAIPGASTVAQLQRNAEAADLDLTPDDEHGSWTQPRPSIPCAVWQLCPHGSGSGLRDKGAVASAPS